MKKYETSVDNLLKKSSGICRTVKSVNKYCFCKFKKV